MLLPSPPPAGRFAPSPTGPLHLGSLIAALGSYLLAHRAGLRWLLRIDDLDQQRVVAGAASEMMTTLEGLGFTWDAEPVWQSRRSERYAEALEQLRQKGLTYSCSCSRKEILASAPHAGEEGPVYPGTCRLGMKGAGRQLATRLKVDGRPIRFEDGIYGDRQQNLSAEVGDFILFRADGLFAYQLATVVDDQDSGVTQVVRGADLLGSTARQIYLYQCLGGRAPSYLHLPLLLDDAGEKISKRHGSQGVVDSRNGNAMMRLALRFLGQQLPPELNSAAAAQMLAWARAAFDPANIGREPRRLSALRAAR